MRALLIGAVEGTRVAMEAIAAAPGWTLAGLLTLPPTLAGRHSDYADLADGAARLGAEVILSPTGNDEAALARAAAIKPDMTFVIGWSSLCGPDLIRAIDGRLIGYHPAALPRLRGRAAIPWTILMDEKITASTLFRVGAGVDDGPILAQHFFHVAPDETASSLYAKHMRALTNALAGLLPRLADDPMLPGEPQDGALATWGARRRPEDGQVDWAQPAASVHRLIRAVGRPYPGAYTFAGSTRVGLWAADLAGEAGRYHARPGQIVAWEEQGGFSVCCGDGGIVRVTEHRLSDGGRLPRQASLGERA